MDDETPVLDTIAALAAVGAPPVSYLANAGTAADLDVTLEGVQGVLVAVAPIIGTAPVRIAVITPDRPTERPSAPHPWIVSHSG
jgi:hypothetical protein